MRKFPMMILLICSLASCSKLSQTNQSEIVLVPSASSMETRGNSDGLSVSEILGEDDRLIFLSAYDITEARNYFTEDTFQNKDGKWRKYDMGQHKPRYWPVAHELSFLAYSCSNKPFVEWGNQDVSRKLDIISDESSLKDDILVAGTDKIMNSADPVNLLFIHTQVWLEVIISANEDEPVSVENIILKDIYRKGHLTVENENQLITCNWDFNKESPKDLNIDISEGNILTSADDKVSAYVMIPPQPSQDLLIEYKVGDKSNSLIIDGKLPVWEQGSHYVYRVIINPLLTKVSGNATKEENIQVELQQLPW